MEMTPACRKPLLLGSALGISPFSSDDGRRDAVSRAPVVSIAFLAAKNWYRARAVGNLRIRP